MDFELVGDLTDIATIAAGRGIHDLIDPWQRERVFWACTIQICEINAHPFLAIGFWTTYRIRRPSGVHDPANHPRCLQLQDLLLDEVLTFLRLAASLLLDGVRTGTYRQMVLDHLPWNPRKLRRFPREHV